MISQPDTLKVIEHQAQGKFNNLHPILNKLKTKKYDANFRPNSMINSCRNISSNM